MQVPHTIMLDIQMCHLSQPGVQVRQVPQLVVGQVEAGEVGQARELVQLGEGVAGEGEAGQHLGQPHRAVDGGDGVAAAVERL